MSKKDEILLNVVYLVFTPDYDVEKAKDEFVKRFGYEPEKITRDHNYLWLGPVRSKQ